MDIKHLEKANGILQAINTLNQILEVIGKLGGIKRDRADRIISDLVEHRNELQKELDEL